MHKTSLVGIGLIVLVFIILAGWIAAHITVGGQSVSMPGIPENTQPVSVLGWLWNNFVSWLGELLPW